MRNPKERFGLRRQRQRRRQHYKTKESRELSQHEHSSRGERFSLSGGVAAEMVA
jgi:hypothetical protein